MVAVLVAACALVLSEPATAAATGVAAYGPRTKPVIALTIDDGWSPATCRAIFDILERRHVPATFFPVGSALGADPALWRQIAARGYPIGDHTATHTLLSGTSEAVQEAAIEAGAAAIRAITGRAPIRVIRPPAGAWDDNTLLAASRAGERLVLVWDTTFGDTSPHPVESRLIQNATRGQNGSVILMHCNHAISARVLERVIDAYQARGFTFVTIPQLFGFKGPVPKYPPFPTPAPPFRMDQNLAARLDRMELETRSLPAAVATPIPSAGLPTATAFATPVATAQVGGGVAAPDRDRPDPGMMVGIGIAVTSICGLAAWLAFLQRMKIRSPHGRHPAPAPAPTGRVSRLA